MPTDNYRIANDRQRSAAQWRSKIKAARDEREVLAVVQDFVSSLTHFEWALLGVQPEAANMESAEELAALSYEVRRMPPPHEQHAELVVSAVTAFFSDALARIAHLGNPRNAHDTA